MKLTNLDTIAHIKTIIFVHSIWIMDRVYFLSCTNHEQVFSTLGSQKLYRLKKKRSHILYFLFTLF